MSERHWAVTEVFKLATERGLHTPSWTPFSEKIYQTTGVRIARGTLAYWYNGQSSPKVEELDAMAKAVGYELDLMAPDREKRG
jgi:transcriptional regulator with XRE-family HTH domain